MSDSLADPFQVIMHFELQARYPSCCNKKTNRNELPWTAATDQAVHRSEDTKAATENAKDAQDKNHKNGPKWFNNWPVGEWGKGWAS